MMNRRLPSRGRRVSGIALTSALIFAGGFAVWSIQPTISHGQAAVPFISERLPLCTPFVPYARDLFAFAQPDAEGASNRDEMRRVAQATFECAASGSLLWSRGEADARLAEVEKQFEVGTNTSMAVSAARVGVVKADFCEAELSHLTRTAEMYRRRNSAGLVGTEDIAPVLAELVALVPICTESAQSR